MRKEIKGLLFSWTIKLDNIYRIKGRERQNKREISYIYNVGEKREREYERQKRDLKL